MSAYTLTEQQEMLADSARHYLSRIKTAKSHARQSDVQVNHPTRWSEMADLGWLALPVPEAYGGLTGSMADICALALGPPPVTDRLLMPPLDWVCVAVILASAPSELPA